MKKLSFLFCLGLLILFKACSPEDETLYSLRGIDEVCNMHVKGQPPVLIDDDLAIQGIVTANNESGNFPNLLLIQSGTKGLALSTKELTTPDVQIGDQILIKVNGLWIGDLNGIAALFSSADKDPIDIAALEIDIISSGNTVVALTYSMANLSDEQSCAFIKLNGVEWQSSDRLMPLADSIRYLMDCDSHYLPVRTEMAALFGSELCADRNGTVQGILFFDQDSAYLKFRTTDEISMMDSLCNEGGGGTSQNDILPIDSLKALYAGTPVPAPAGKYIQGIVISDKNSGNITGKNLVLQDQSAGITVRFDVNNIFEMGDEILVDMTGAELSEYNGLFQLNFTPLANTIKLSDGNTVAPRATTIPDIFTNGEAWESTLIEIYQIDYITTTGTYSGLGDFSDGTNTIPTYVRSAALFAADNVPAVTIDTVVAIVSDFNGTQLIIRNTADVGQ